MQLPYLSSVNDAEITIEKLDKVAKTLSDKIKKFAKFFGIVLGWIVLNTIIAIFFNRTHSLSFDAIRAIRDGFNQVNAMDLSFYLAFFVENKISSVISLAVIFICGWGYACLFTEIARDGSTHQRVRNYAKYAQRDVQIDAYVVSYKQQVAFLA